MRTNSNCSVHFRFDDFYYCSETWQTSPFENIPACAETVSAISELATNILDKVVDQFGPIKITYGFCSSKLANLIKKKDKPGIAPELDQHAGHEINSRGRRICKRDGFACDFILPGADMRKIARWIASNCDFDSIYFYGENRPLHVSYSPNNKRQIVIIKTINNKKIPQVVKEKEF